MNAPPPTPPPQTPETWMAALSRVMARVTAAAEEDSATDALLAGLVDEFGAAFARIWLIDPSDGALHLHASAGDVEDQEAHSDPVPTHEPASSVALALMRQEEVIIEEIGPDSGMRDFEWVQREGLHSFAGFPLAIGDRLVGAMVVYGRTPLPPVVVEALRVLAQQAALALEHERIVEESHTLQLIAAEAAAARDPDSLMDRIVRRTLSAFGADGSAVWLENEDGMLDVGAMVGMSNEFYDNLQSGATNDPSALYREIQRSGRPLYTRDDQAEARARNAVLAAALEAEGVVSALRLPLFEPGGEVMGMLALYHKRERLYTESEVRLAQAFADQIAVAMHNALLAEQEHEAQVEADRQVERLRTLTLITEQLLASSDPDSVLEIVVANAVRLCNARGAVAALVQGGGTRLVPTASHGDLQAWFDTFSETELDPRYLQESATGRAVSSGEPVLVEDYAALPARHERTERTQRAGVRSFIAAPMRTDRALLGVLWVADTRPDSLTQEDADLVQALADQAALALEQARLIEESHALQELAAELASTRDPQQLLDAIVQRTLTAMNANACAVWLLNDARNRLTAAASVGLLQSFLDAAHALSDRENEITSAAFLQIQRTRRPSFTLNEPGSDAPEDEDLARTFQDAGIVSALRLPLFEPGGGDVIGMLALYHQRERAYSEGEIRLAQAYTDQLAVALHNATLARNERLARETAARQLERITTLSKITERLLASNDLETVLRVVVDSGRRLCDARGAMVGLIDDERRYITPVALEGEPRQWLEQFGRTVLDEHYLAHTPTGQAISRRVTVAVPDYATWGNLHEAQAETLAVGVRSFIAAPLLLGRTPIGVLWVNDTRPRNFTPEDATLVQALADQAALAIDHARLVRRGQDAAVLEERTRLARDLHDSVTQSVFSLGMLAKAAQTQHERGASALEGTLERIAQLSQDALKEMRALLFELQPTGLAEEGLAAALEKLVAAFRVRVDLAVTLYGDTDLRLPADVETAVFRIVQEALNNAAKHARATEVTVSVAVLDDGLRVTVEDDGIGFEMDAPAAPTDGTGGMGMRGMFDRAAAAGLTLRMSSRPGQGTRVTVEAPLPEEERMAAR